MNENLDVNAVHGLYNKEQFKNWKTMQSIMVTMAAVTFNMPINSNNAVYTI